LAPLQQHLTLEVEDSLTGVVMARGYYVISERSTKIKRIPVYLCEGGEATGGGAKQQKGPCIGE
jgi:predicted esterase